MDTANLILPSWKKEQQVFDKNLAVLRQKLNKEAIHDLRVAIKKLRAYLELFLLIQNETEAIPGEAKQYLYKTEALFNILGRQRDVEICLELTDAIKKEAGYTCPQFTIYLRALLKMAKAWSNQEIHRYNKKELTKIAFLLKQEKPAEDAVELNQKIKALITKLLAELVTHFRQPHQLRKILKQVYYWLNQLNDNKKYLPDTLHNILDDLGSWQEHEVLSVRLKHFRKDYLPKPFEEYAVLKEMETIIDEKKKALINAARNKTRHWLKTINMK